MKGIIFDMDGVLIDSAEAHFHAWHSLGKEIGTPHTREFFNSTFGMHNNQIMPRWLGASLDPGDGQRLAERKEVIFREVVSQHLTALPGAQEFVAAAREAGYLCAVGSSGPRRNVETALDILGIRHLFHHLATGDDVTEGKPHPEVFLMAAAGLGLKPSRAVVIEDAPQGVEAGLAAGCPVVALTTSRPGEDLRGAHLIEESLATLRLTQVEALLGAWRSGPTD
jgi:beta-phosphoglucomutase